LISHAKTPVIRSLFKWKVPIWNADYILGKRRKAAKRALRE